MIAPSPASSDLVEHISAQIGSLPSARRLAPYLAYSAGVESASGPPARGRAGSGLDAGRIRQVRRQPSGRRQAADLRRNVLDQVACLLYTSPSPRDGLLSRMPSSA